MGGTAEFISLPLPPTLLPAARVVNLPTLSKLANLDPVADRMSVGKQKRMGWSLVYSPITNARLGSLSVRHVHWARW